MIHHEKIHGGVWQKLAITIGLAIVMLLMVAIKIYIQNNNSFHHAELAFESQNRELAIRLYERTIRWYLPFNGHVNAAIKRLWQIAEQAETSKDFNLAKTTYARLRSSLYAIQHFYQPYQDWIAKCDRKLMPLSTSIPQDPTKGVHPDKTQRIGKSLPHAGWALLVLIGFWGWIYSTIALILKGNNDDAVGRKANMFIRFRWLWMITGFYLLWAISLARA